MFKEAFNPKREVKMSVRIALRNELVRFSNNHVRKYILMCFDQAVEFLDAFASSSKEISPLLAFYSVLNLTKVHILLRQQMHQIMKRQVDRLFSSHGAFSSTIEKVKINQSGTFISLAQLYWSNYGNFIGQEISLHKLYRSIPDLADALKRVYSEDSFYVRAFPAEEFRETIYSMPHSVNDIGLVVSTAYGDTVAQVVQDGWRRDDFEGWTYFFRDIGTHDVKEKRKAYFNLFSFSMDKSHFLNIKPQNSIPELCALYLILLKYSSLVRYQPKNWKDKLEGRERTIIDKFCDQCVFKYWSILSSQYTGNFEYII